MEKILPAIRSKSSYFSYYWNSGKLRPTSLVVA